MEGAASASAHRVRKDGGYYAWMEGGRGGATVRSGEGVVDEFVVGQYVIKVLQKKKSIKLKQTC